MSLARYNCRDLVGTDDVLRGLLKELADVDGMATWRLENAMIRPVVRMQRWGMLIDKDRMKLYRGHCLTEYDAACKELETAFGGLFNPNSTADVSRVLYEEMKLPVIKMTDGGQSGNKKPSVDEDTILQLQLLVPEEHHHLFQRILDARHWDKMRSTYVDGLPIDEDWRVRSEFRIFGTRTGRLASRNPNLQNIPMDDLGCEACLFATKLDERGRCSVCGGPAIGFARSCYIAQPGWKLIHWDLSQAELRLQALLAGCNRMLRLFDRYDFYKERGYANLARHYRIHTHNAAAMWQKRICDPEREAYHATQGEAPSSEERLTAWARAHLSEVEAHCTSAERKCEIDLVTPQMEYRGKIFVYGVSYGGSVEGVLARGGRGLSRGDQQVAILQQMINNYWDYYPEIRDWRNQLQEMIIRTRFHRSWGGRPRVFFSKNDDMLREILDYDPQAGVADRMNPMLVELDRLFYDEMKLPGSLCNQVHDCLMAETPDEFSEEVVQLGLQEARKEVVVAGRPYRFYSSGKAGQNWGLFT